MEVDNVQIELGQNLKMHRKKLKMNQQTIAEQLNIDRSTYSCYEIGKTYPPIDTLIRLSKVFHTTVDELLGVEHNDPLIVAESAPAYETASPATLTQSERTILMKLRELDSESLAKVNQLIDECLNNLD